MPWIITEFAALALVAVLAVIALRALRNTPPHSRLARGPRRAPISSDLHRIAEEADRNDVRVNTWRYRYWRRMGHWPTGELDDLVLLSRDLPMLLRRQAA